MKYLAEVSRALKNGIYIIYMGFCRAICRFIAASTSEFFFRPRPSASDEKKMPRFRGYILAYSPPKTHIYITYILFWGLYPDTQNSPYNTDHLNLHISPIGGYIPAYSPQLGAIYNI